MRYGLTVINIIMAGVNLPFALDGLALNVVSFGVCAACAGFTFALDWSE